MASPWAPGGPPAHDLHPRLSSDSTPPSHSSHSSPAAPFPSALRVRRKPLPQHVDPVIPGTDQLSTPPLSVDQDTPTSLPTSNALPFARSPSPSTDGDSFISLPRNSIRYSRGGIPPQPLRIDTASASFLRSVIEDDDDDSDDEGADVLDENYEHQFSNGTPVHSRLVSEPFIPLLKSPPPTKRRATTMALHPPASQPPPLHIDVDARAMSVSATDPKQPKTPGNKISSFFGWKTATSPGADSSSTEISDNGRSPTASPMPPLANVPMKPSSPYDGTKPNGFGLARNASFGSAGAQENLQASNMADLENELREISSELAGSIRREMELEDLVERLQSEPSDANRRTSDYFSDSGTSSIRYASDAGAARTEDIEKIKRAAEQERAQLKVELSQKLQEERSQRTAFESHIQILENQVQQLRRERVDSSDISSKARELELALENTRRKLLEERQSKDNFEDLLTAMRVELEQLRNERDVLRDGNTPQAEFQRLKEEMEALKIENASLAKLHGTRFASIAEEGVSNNRNSVFGLSRSNSLARMPSKAGGLARSGSLSRSNSQSGGKNRESHESLVDKVKDTETQRDALHRTLKSLLSRQTFLAREHEKRMRILEMELARAQQSGLPRKLGYEREVRILREDVNQLRLRAEEALDGKWQCEKNLAGLKMDLDRAEQETSSLRVLLQELDTAGSEGDQESSSLQSAYQQLQVDRERAKASAARLPNDRLAASIQRSDVLAKNIRLQVQTNDSLRDRLASAIDKGERDQKYSTERINMLQSRLKESEDALQFAQQHSEEEMNMHEEEIRQLQENHNAQLMRMKNGARDVVGLSPRPPNTPFDARSPRLDKTTSGDGVPLTDVVRAEDLERGVQKLEKLLREADMEMEEAVGRMNRAQIDVAELQSSRDEALRQTRSLQAEIQTARDAFQSLLGSA